MSSVDIKKFVLTWLTSMLFFHSQAQTGNKVFTGSEFVNAGTFSLLTPGSQSIVTDRSANPGYVTAINGAIFLNASDANNINGYVKKHGNLPFTFPVGSGTEIRSLSISAPSNITDAYATAWIPGDPGGNLDPTGPNGGAHPVTEVIFPIKAVSKIGQWDWQTGTNMVTTGNGVGLTVTVSMPDLTAFNVPLALRLVGWNGSSWVDLSGWPTATGNTRNSLVSGTMIAGISAIGIGSTYWVLPLKLVSFTALEKDCYASINWTTTNEENMGYFDIEQSNDGITYQLAAVVKAVNNSNQNSYAFRIPQNYGEGYYRLKMVGKDGSFTYSPVEHLKMNCKIRSDELILYPNPSNWGFVFVSFSSYYAGTAKIQFLNMAGQKIMAKNITVQVGQNNIKIESELLSKGVYLVQLFSSDNNTKYQTQKLIIE